MHFKASFVDKKYFTWRHAFKDRGSIFLLYKVDYSRSFNYSSRVLLGVVLFLKVGFLPVLQVVGTIEYWKCFLCSLPFPVIRFLFFLSTLSVLRYLGLHGILIPQIVHHKSWVISTKMLTNFFLKKVETKNNEREWNSGGQ